MVYGMRAYWNVTCARARVLCTCARDLVPIAYRDIIIDDKSYYQNNNTIIKKCIYGEIQYNTTDRQVILNTK